MGTTTRSSQLPEDLRQCNSGHFDLCVGSLYRGTGATEARYGLQRWPQRRVSPGGGAALADRKQKRLGAGNTNSRLGNATTRSGAPGCFSNPIRTSVLYNEIGRRGSTEGSTPELQAMKLWAASADPIVKWDTDKLALWRMESRWHPTPYLNPQRLH